MLMVRLTHSTPWFMFSHTHIRKKTTRKPAACPYCPPRSCYFVHDPQPSTLKTLNESEFVLILSLVCRLSSDFSRHCRRSALVSTSVIKLEPCKVLPLQRFSGKPHAEQFDCVFWNTRFLYLTENLSWMNSIFSIVQKKKRKFANKLIIITLTWFSPRNRFRLWTLLSKDNSSRSPKKYVFSNTCNCNSSVCSLSSFKFRKQYILFHSFM